jgi:hypothetical protein
MKWRANLRGAASEAGTPRGHGSVVEQLLYMLGASVEFTDAVMGDLTEEYVLREAKHGISHARLWYAAEILRSAPHLVHGALRHASPRARLRFAAFAGAIALTLTVIVVAVLHLDGPPAQLIAQSGSATEGVVVNNVKPVQLETHVLDKAGHLLVSKDVRYKWMSGVRIPVSQSGVVTCKREGDATVRASLGSIATDVEVWCRPVTELRAGSWTDFVAGDPPRHLQYTALGADGAAVTQLRGSARVIDSSVATLSGAILIPKAVGRTMVEVEIGDRETRMEVIVHERVRNFDRLRPDQSFVAAPIRLERGDTVHMSLPLGTIWLKYLPRRSGEAPPTITVDGPVVCTPGNGLRSYLVPSDEFGTYCYVRAPGATVIAGHGVAGVPVVEGSLAIERMK